MKRVLVTPPAKEPVDVTGFRLHARIDSHEEDSVLETLLTAAREAAEELLWQRLITQTWDQYFDRFCDPLRLDLSPVQSLSSVKYLDSNGTLQTLAASVYELGDQDGLGIVRLKYNQSWPVTRGVGDCVVVRYVVGYGDDQADVPETIRAAIRIHAAHHHRFRAGEPLPAAFANTLIPLSSRRFR